jgi:hypothetical protein
VLHEVLLDQELEPVNFVNLVVFLLLIQSKRQPRARSAARRKIDPDGLDLLALEVAFELLLRSLGQFKVGHVGLHKK